MAQGRRITVDMFDESLRDAVMGNTNIIPISTVADLPSSDTGKMYRVLTGAEKHNIYTWDVDAKRYVLIGADDRDIRWPDIMEKPSTFPASPHTHPWSEVTGKPTTFPPSTHGHDWSEVTGKPTTFAPSTHNHPWDEVVGKPPTFPPSTHTHTQADVEGLSDALNAKVSKVEGKDLSTNDFTDNLKDKLESISNSASVSYDAMLEALNAHRNDSSIHLTEAELADISLVQNKADKSYVDTQLASKAPLSTFNGHTGNATIHVTQADKDAWNSKSTFDGDYEKLINIPSTFTPSSHSHGWSEIEGKPATFAPDTHSHGWTEITGKPSTFAPSTHSHAWSSITGKPTTFAPSTHTHSYNDLTDKPVIKSYSAEVSETQPASADMWYKVIG